MRSNFRKRWDHLTLKLEAIYRIHSYRKAAKARLKHINSGYDCKQEYKATVIPFWAKYNIKPNKMWWQIFSERDGIVDPRYIPDDLWYGEIVPYYSNSLFRRFGEDKCQHDLFFPNLKKPKTIVKNIAGIYYDGQMNLISKSQAAKICKDWHDEFLIKPSIDSGEGRLIQFISSDASKTEIDNTFDEFKANFIAQEKIHQHEDLAKLNESSLNTVRIVSFLFKNKVHILSSILRMGASGSRLDNIGAGGFACVIKADGRLEAQGVNRKSEWVTENQHGIQFKDIVVPEYDSMIELIKQEHARKAHFKLIGWDFCVDENSDPVFIEYNVCPGQNQITSGPTFGDLTEEVLQDVFIDRELRHAQN